VIDEDWLRGLRVVTPRGNIVGLLGIGSESIVFEVVMPDGIRLARSIRKNHLGFHIREVSHTLTDAPGYDLDRVNAKLLQLLDSQLVDSMTHPYDQLYSKIIKILHQRGIPGVTFSSRSPDSVDSIPFILHTRGLHRRLTEIASLNSGEKGDLELVTINGHSYSITGHRAELAVWAESMLEQISRNASGFRRNG
jgi:hypothetical protein